MEANHDDYNSIMEDSRNMIMIKGKRTKRPRPSSPLALTMASTSSTTTTATTTTGATSHDDQDGDHTNIVSPNYAFLHIPTTNNSIEFTRIVQEHDDDQDMANCLILLAQGQSNNSPSPPPPNKAGAEVHGATTSGFYVYECKTCNRGFSSFQALGGHRASHKKPPKPTVEDKIKSNTVKREVGVDHHTTLSLQIGSNPQTRCNPSSGGSIKAAKVHECSICGAEFGSGQALGGHMRRHRSMPMATTTCSNNSSHGCYQESKKPKSLLSLDLNLPAPVEDDHRETKLIPFRSKDQMIVFSNSSLVHCHL